MEKLSNLFISFLVQQDCISERSVQSKAWTAIGPFVTSTINFRKLRELYFVLPSVLTRKRFPTVENRHSTNTLIWRKSRKEMRRKLNLIKIDFWRINGRNWSSKIKIPPFSVQRYIVIVSKKQCVMIISSNYQLEIRNLKHVDTITLINPRNNSICRKIFDKYGYNLSTIWKNFLPSTFFLISFSTTLPIFFPLLPYLPFGSGTR